MNYKTINQNASAKIKLARIDSASIDVSKVNVKLLKAIKVDANGKLMAMKISTYETERVLGGYKND